MNKNGKADAMIYVVIVLIGGFLLYSGGFFDKDVPVDGAPLGRAPSDLQTTFDMSFKDELATTETTVNAVWYAFKASDGSYVNSGTATGGTSSLTTNFGEKYDVWAYTTGYVGYIAKLTTIEATAAKVPVTIALVKRGALQVVGVDDPIDLDNNLTGTAGSTEAFRVKWKVNVSNAGSLNPFVYIETNNTATGVEDVTITQTDSAGGAWTEITCPDRLTQSNTAEKFYCFQRDKMALASDGVIITSATILIDSSTAVTELDKIRVRMGDTGMYLEPGYTNIDGILFGAENDANSMIGTPSDTTASGITATLDFTD